jgi:hypothetical protein
MVMTEVALARNSEAAVGLGQANVPVPAGIWISPLVHNFGALAAGDLQVVYNLLDALDLTRKLLSSRFLLRRLDGAVQINNTVIGIDVDARQVRGFLRHKGRLDRCR